MKKVLVIALVSLILFSSCARGITTYEAAHGKAKCGRYIK